MEKWTVTLADGTALEGLTLNGNNFISPKKITEDTFAGNLDKVTMTNGTTTEEHKNMELVQIQKVGTTYWFVLRDLSAEELQQAKNRGDIDYIAMMASINLEEA